MKAINVIVKEDHCVVETKQIFVKPAHCVQRNGHWRNKTVYLLHHTVYDWLIEHDAYYNFNENTRRISLYDENVAFAFKMRWG